VDNFLFFLLYNSAPAGVWQGLKDLLALALEKLYSLTVVMGLPSYALAIILFTVILKLVLYPLTAKQMHSTRKMQRLQPKVDELKAKYKNDPQRQQSEMMKLYKESGVNTLGGCLPLLVQMPVLIALYRTLASFHPLHPEHYNFFWIADLSKPDIYIIFPVLVGVTTFLQQYLSMTNKKDQTQKMMLYIFPIMFGWMTRNFAAGLAVYWVTYSVVGSIQQLFINKKGKIDDEKYAAEEACRKEKEAAAKGLEAGKGDAEKNTEAGDGTTLSQEMAKKVPTSGQRRKLRKKK